MYVEGSYEALKGKAGEDVVQRFLESKGYEVTPQPDGKGSRVDFAVFDKKSGESWFVEVKTQIRLSFMHRSDFCFHFPVEKINKYVAYAKKHNARVDLYIVDTRYCKIYYQSILKLHNICSGNKNDFPYDTTAKDMDNEPARFFHYKQFKTAGGIFKNEIIIFQGICPFKTGAVRTKHEISRRTTPFTRIDDYTDIQCVDNGDISVFAIECNACENFEQCQNNRAYYIERTSFLNALLSFCDDDNLKKFLGKIIFEGFKLLQINWFNSIEEKIFNPIKIENEDEEDEDAEYETICDEVKPEYKSFMLYHDVVNIFVPEIISGLRRRGVDTSPVVSFLNIIAEKYRAIYLPKTYFYTEQPYITAVPRSRYVKQIGIVKKNIIDIPVYLAINHTVYLDINTFTYALLERRLFDEQEKNYWRCFIFRYAEYVVDFDKLILCISWENAAEILENSDIRNREIYKAVDKIISKQKIS
ncbi:MAG: hypothetical protein K6G55_06650 [Selenomonadaceae bacterium]|nr:hypothetical protein [Selenomonadaceae bacterium]